MADPSTGRHHILNRTIRSGKPGIDADTRSGQNDRLTASHNGHAGSNRWLHRSICDGLDGPVSWPIQVHRMANRGLCIDWRKWKNLATRQREYEINMHSGTHIETDCNCEDPTELDTTELLREELLDSAGGNSTKILLVDDTDSMLLLLSQYLESLGYDEILTAASANEAFKHLMPDPEDPASRAVDLILMDINMPGLDGIEACRRIKTEMGFNDVPVIMVTSEVDTDHLKQAFDAGAMDYIKKPFNRLELRVRVESALKLKHALDAQKRVNALLAEKNQALKQAMDNVKVLQGLLPICASCKKIRDEAGSWNVMEGYISDHSEAEFSHGICPDCQQRLYPEIYRKLEERGLA